jgi:hypothetical protein
MATPSSGWSSHFVVLTATLKKIQVLGDITPCRLVITDVSNMTTPSSGCDSLLGLLKLPFGTYT